MEVKDGVLYVEPYEYYDRDAMFICAPLILLVLFLHYFPGYGLHYRVYHLICRLLRQALLLRGLLYVEPYEYYDRDAMFICAPEVLFAIADGTMDTFLSNLHIRFSGFCGTIYNCMEIPFMI